MNNSVVVGSWVIMMLSLIIGVLVAWYYSLKE